MYSLRLLAILPICTSLCWGATKDVAPPEEELAFLRDLAELTGEKLMLNIDSIVFQACDGSDDGALEQMKALAVSSSSDLAVSFSPSETADSLAIGGGRSLLVIAPTCLCTSNLTGSIFVRKDLLRSPALLRRDCLPRLPTLRLDSQVFLYDFGSGGSVSLSEAYSVAGGNSIVNDLGVVGRSASGALTLAAPEAAWERRCDLAGAVLRSSELEWPPLTQADLKSGFIPDLIGVIADRCNFSVAAERPADRLWGNPVDESGLVYDGIVGAVASGEADLSTACLYVSRDRADVVEFTTVTFEDTVTLHRTREALAGRSLRFEAFWVCMLRIHKIKGP